MKTEGRQEQAEQIHSFLCCKYNKSNFILTSGLAIGINFIFSCIYLVLTIAVDQNCLVLALNIASVIFTLIQAILAVVIFAQFKEDTSLWFNIPRGCYSLSKSRHKVLIAIY